MKRNIHKNLLGMLKSKGVLAISSGLLLVSCGAQMGGYSETDGVYYDPNKDTLPEGVIINDGGNRVGEYYDYYQNDSNLIQNAEANSKENRYDSWNDYNVNGNATDSDWGAFAGSQTNYYDNSWGYSPWGWGGMYGGYSPYWGMNSGWGWGLGLSWGGSWGWGGGWNMGWGYSPWGWGGYNPYWGGGYYGYGYGYGYGSPYWGWGGGGYWGNNYNRPVYRRSGMNGNTYTGGFGNSNSNRNSIIRNSGGFRNSNAYTGGFRNSGNNGNAGGFRNSNNAGGFRQQGNMNGGNRNQSGFRQSRPNYNYQQPQQSQPRYRNDSGFRNDSGYRNSGSYNNSNSGGGFRSGGGFSGGSSGGGGFRSSGGGGGGGFRR